MNENQNYFEGIEQSDNIVHVLHQMQQQLTQLNKSVDNLTLMRDTLVDEIQLDSLTLEVVLEVSDSTLYRWRTAGTLPHHTRPNGTIFYCYNEVLQALRKGELCARGFYRLKAIEKMIQYRDDFLKTRGGSSWMIVDKKHEHFK